MANRDFVHLHVHSDYSLLDGLGKVAQLVSKAKELGMSSLALTDHGAMYGAIDFYQECLSQELKPIIGVEAYLASGKLTERSNIKEAKPYHMVLLAKNLIGYKNLMKLTSLAHLEGYYYKPRIDKDILSRHSKGLIATSACLASETSQLILDKNWSALEETIQQYAEIFGKDHYYLELQHHPSIPEQQVVNQHLRRMAEKFKLPLIVTNDVHYVNSSDNVAHDTLVCIQTGKLVSDTDRMVYAGDFSMKTAEEMLQPFSDIPEALSNTAKIASMCRLEIPLHQSLLPHFPLPEGETEESLLRKWCEDGLHWRYQRITPEIQERLNYELNMVNKMGFPGYFLIVADFVRYARSQGILVGPGRGSAAGSLIAYLTGITNIDPLRYNLLFERFLDLNRVTLPDIDLDFEDTRRKEVIDYIVNKYGSDHVAGIITFGTIMARAAVRDVGRVLGYSYNQVDAIAKKVPPPVQGRHIPLSKSIEDSPELREVYQNDPQAKQILDQAIKVEGTIRHASQHACALVISKEPLEEYTPVQLAQGGDVHQITQYSMNPIDSIGLLKIDILGLANLSILKRSCEIIEAVYGDKIDLEKLPLDDKKSFELLGKGETTGVFQLESAGMKRYIKELKPNQFEDIIAIVALYRPGPIQWIESFINRKNKIEPITYLHPLAEEALRETYGIPVYQEQVMRMSKDMCGFDAAQADTLRKAIGKKIPKLMKEIRVKFINGAVQRGVDKSKAEEIFRQLEDFAAYCFNKSHATCYALIAYQTAYLKAHYPDCFMAALMTSDRDNIDRLSIEISESERLGLNVLPPCVNESFADFAVVKGKKAIRFGLSAIKNVGESVAKNIVKERKTNGLFLSLEDFLRRAGPFLNKKVLDSLVRAGALDTFASRSDLYASLELLVKFSASNAKGKANHQSTLFAEQSDSTLEKIALAKGKTSESAHLTWEKELLGLYLSAHPLKNYQITLEKSSASPISEIVHLPAGQVVRTAGIIRSLKKITTKNGQIMAFVEIEDISSNIELIIFPNLFAANVQFLQNNQAIFVQGKISDKDGTPKILADYLCDLDGLDLTKIPPSNNHSRNNKTFSQLSQLEPSGHNLKEFIIDLNSHTPKETLVKLKNLLLANQGTTLVKLRLSSNSGTRIVDTKIKVTINQSLQDQIRQLIN